MITAAVSVKNKTKWQLAPSIEEEELALAVLLPVGEVTFEAVTGGIGDSAAAVRQTIFIHWTWTHKHTHSQHNAIQLTASHFLNSLLISVPSSNTLFNQSNTTGF